MVIKPRFLAAMGYQIFLTMVLHTRSSAITEFGQRLSKKVNMAAIFTDVHRFAKEKLRCKNDNGREKAT